MQIDPQMILLLKGFGIYALIGVIMNLSARVAEVLDYMRRAEATNTPFRVGRFMEAWKLETSYDAQMYGIMFFGIFWPIGFCIHPFIYGRAWMYMWTYPFRRMKVRLIPNWMRLEVILNRLNERRKAEGVDLW